VDENELWTFEQIAEHAGVEVNTAKIWRKRHHDFPEPAETIGATYRFRAAKVLEWLAKPRPPGRPRKAADPAEATA